MKKLLLAISIFVAILSLSSLSVFASNFVLDTDIVAFIDEYPIQSCSIDNSVYIYLDDLKDYGFDLIENNSSIHITRNIQKEINLMDTKKLNKLKRKDIEIEKPLFEVYSSDTKIYIDNELINAFDIDKKPVIKLYELSKFGYFTWYGDQREVKIDMLSFEIDNELKNVPSSKEPKNSYGIINKIDNGDSFLQKGYFDEKGNLIYGIEKEEVLWQNNSKAYYEKRGNFKDNKFIYLFTTYYGGYGNINYINNDYYTYLIKDSNFEYNRFIICEIKDMYMYKYLQSNGNLFLKQHLVENNFKSIRYDSNLETFWGIEGPYSTIPNIITDEIFEATLYDETQKEIYSGEVQVKNIAQDNVSPAVYIYYAKNYSASDGIIYSPTGCLCYIGNVSNGLPNGKGKLYNTSYYRQLDSETEEYKIYSIDGVTIEHKKPNLIYDGYFKDALYDGQGTLYYVGVGRISSKGTWKEGKKNGHFTEYSDAGNIYISFVGDYKDDRQYGYGVTYAPKGFLDYEGVYKSYEGTFGYNYPEGFLKRYELLYLSEENIHKVYLSTQSIIKYNGDNKDEVSISYDSNGNIEKQEHYINEVLQND